jgi:hypothetical protein
LFAALALFALFALRPLLTLFALFAIVASLSFFTLQPNLAPLTLQSPLALHPALARHAILHVSQALRHFRRQRVLQLKIIGTQIGQYLISLRLEHFDITRQRLKLTRPFPTQLRDDSGSSVKKRF